jgi:CRP-like cAMP-binding protein
MSHLTMRPGILQFNNGTRVTEPEERTSCDGQPIRNRILLALPDAEYQTLRPCLSLVELPAQTTLHEPGERLEFAYFPNRGLISLLVVTREGKTVEVGMVGDEGLIGTPAVVGLNRSSHRAIVQISGDAFRLRIEALLSLLPSVPQLRLLASRHAVIQGMQAAQFAACNRLHRIEQRLARWLLVMQDRVENRPLYITHDVLAATLGTDRPSVSLAAGILQRKGAIGYNRGVVIILSPAKVEEAACECYGVMKTFNNILLSKWPQ